jgi:predicted pyridoxine 5'-phosphate oxidase superfamily flavin-nucleotide-binding protein
MDLDDARAVIATQHHAVLATLRRDGTPQMSPVLATVDGQDRGVVSSRETAFKVRNLRRDPRCACARCPTGSTAAGSRSVARREAWVLLQIELASAGPDREG